MTTHVSEPTGPVGTEVVSESEERFDRWRRRLGLILAPVALGATYWLTAAHLAYQGAALSGVLAAVAVLCSKTLSIGRREVSEWVLRGV